MAETKLITGPLLDAHDVLAPLRLQSGKPVGASDPVAPVIVAV